ncbi:MAG: hypothetical protein GY851_17465 [bacterium]|nr:hypothetical protein [bacterium]
MNRTSLGLATVVFLVLMLAFHGCGGSSDEEATSESAPAEQQAEPAPAEKEAEAPPAPEAKPAEQNRERRGGRFTVEEVLGRYDKDGDEKLTEGEVGEEAWGRVGRADADKDGTVTKEELETALSRMRRGRNPMPESSAEAMTQYDADGDGQIKDDEIPESLRRRVPIMDANGDGALDREELDAAYKRMQAGRRGRQ